MQNTETNHVSKHDAINIVSENFGRQNCQKHENPMKINKNCRLNMKNLCQHLIN